MARLPVFSEISKNQLVRMRPAAPPNEDELQSLIARFPDMITGSGERMLLIRREQSVPDTLDGTARWSLDHLFVTESAVPVFVEVKRATDTRIRREVIGQILDYAANGVAYWSPGAMADSFTQQCRQDGLDPGSTLREFLKEGSTEEFWAQVDANLSAGRIQMIIAADVIPKELARIVEFLNEQMSASIIAVELSYYESEDGHRTLVPRIIGETERTDLRKGTLRQKLDPISIEEWIAKNIAPLGAQVLSGARKFLDLSVSAGAELVIPDTQGSIVLKFNAQSGITVYPFYLASSGKLSIGFGYVTKRPRLSNEEDRQKYWDAFNIIVGGISTENLTGYPSFPIERLNDAEVFSDFEKLFQRFIADAMSEV
jgi:hypothetical protein